MIRSLVPAIALCLLVSTAFPGEHPSLPGAAVDTADEEAAVLALLDRFMNAISEQDFAAIAAMQTPDGVTYRARALDGGRWDVTMRPNSYWADSSNRSSRDLRERYWSPTVHVRGGIAVVWAPYEFRVDGRSSHCGVDVFNLVKIDGEWRVSSSMWTVEPDACAGLRPADPSEIRPKQQ